MKEKNALKLFNFIEELQLAENPWYSYCMFVVVVFVSFTFVVYVIFIILDNVWRGYL